MVNQLLDGIHFVSNLAKKYAATNEAESIINNEMMNYFLNGLNKIGFSNDDFSKKRLELDVQINTQGLIYWQSK